MSISVCILTEMRYLKFVIASVSLIQRVCQKKTRQCSHKSHSDVFITAFEHASLIRLCVTRQIDDSIEYTTKLRIDPHFFVCGD